MSCVVNVNRGYNFRTIGDMDASDLACMAWIKKKLISRAIANETKLNDLVTTIVTFLLKYFYDLLPSSALFLGVYKNILFHIIYYESICLLKTMTSSVTF